MALQMTPMQIKKMTLKKPSQTDAAWLRDSLERVNRSYGAHIDLTAHERLSLRWGAATQPSVRAAEEHAR
jgi:hypothetical protein